MTERRQFVPCAGDGCDRWKNRFVRAAAETGPADRFPDVRDSYGDLRHVSFRHREKIEMSKAHALSAGGFHALSAGDHHYAFAKAQTVVQVDGMGPFNITYINPDDDPQKAKK